MLMKREQWQLFVISDAVSRPVEHFSEQKTEQELARIPGILARLPTQEMLRSLERCSVQALVQRVVPETWPPRSGLR